VEAHDSTAYFARAVSYVRKMFMQLTAGVNVKKTLFSCVVDTLTNKLECLPLTSLMFVNKTSGYLS
jgi:hypothetical protein